MEIQILPRFQGPDNSGNGGYSCGMLAKHISGPAQVRLFLPPPLSETLDINQQEGKWQMTHQGKLIASASPYNPYNMNSDKIPAAPSLEQARQAREAYSGHKITSIHTVLSVARRASPMMASACLPAKWKVHILLPATGSPVKI